MTKQEIAQLFRTYIDEPTKSFITDDNVKLYLKLGYDQFREIAAQCDPKIFQEAFPLGNLGGITQFDLKQNPGVGGFPSYLGTNAFSNGRGLLKAYEVVSYTGGNFSPSSVGASEATPSIWLLGASGSSGTGSVTYGTASTWTLNISGSDEVLLNAFYGPPANNKSFFLSASYGGNKAAWYADFAKYVIGAGGYISLANTGSYDLIYITSSAGSGSATLLNPQPNLNLQVLNYGPSGSLMLSQSATCSGPTGTLGTPATWEYVINTQDPVLNTSASISGMGPYHQYILSNYTPPLTPPYDFPSYYSALQNDIANRGGSLSGSFDTGSGVATISISSSNGQNPFTIMAGFYNISNGTFVQHSTGSNQIIGTSSSGGGGGGGNLDIKSVTVNGHTVLSSSYTSSAAFLTATYNLFTSAGASIYGLSEGGIIQSSAGYNTLNWNIVLNSGSLVSLQIQNGKAATGTNQGATPSIWQTSFTASGSSSSSLAANVNGTVYTIPASGNSGQAFLNFANAVNNANGYLSWGPDGSKFKVYSQLGANSMTYNFYSIPAGTATTTQLQIGAGTNQPSGFGGPNSQLNIVYVMRGAASMNELYIPTMMMAPSYMLVNGTIFFSQPIQGNILIFGMKQQDPTMWNDLNSTDYPDDLVEFHDLIALLAYRHYAIRDGALAQPTEIQMQQRIQDFREYVMYGRQTRAANHVLQEQYDNYFY